MLKRFDLIASVCCFGVLFCTALFAQDGRKLAETMRKVRSDIKYCALAEAETLMKSCDRSDLVAQASIIACEKVSVNGFIALYDVSPIKHTEKIEADIEQYKLAVQKEILPEIMRRRVEKSICMAKPSE